MQESEGSFSSSMGWTLPGFRIGKNYISWMRHLETLGKRNVILFCLFFSPQALRLNADDTFGWKCLIQSVKTKTWRTSGLFLVNKQSERVQALQYAVEWPRLISSHTQVLWLRTWGDLLEPVMERTPGSRPVLDVSWNILSHLLITSLLAEALIEIVNIT